MPVAFGDGREPGRAAATDRPYGDKWGSFMTGWAPLIDTTGEQFGALGIDVDSSRYLAHLERARFWALVGALPATLLVLLGGLWFYRVRLRALRDAREAALASRELGREQERLRNVIEGTRVGVWEARIDPDSGTHLITVDDRWAAMLGRSAGELNPITPERFMPLLVHPEDAPAVMAAIDAALGEDEYIFDMDARMRHADGRWVWTEVRGKVVERDGQGRALRMAGTQMDVSARKAAELSLQEQQGSFRSLFELSPVGICLAEFPAGRFLNANAAMVALLGYSREELLQLNYMDITPDEYRDADREQASLVERNTRFGPYVKEFVHKAGHRVRVMMSGARMKDATGRDVTWVIVQELSGS
jgi:PAS domain S-box-containing protein